MSLAIGNGGPTAAEIERLRLILSTYRDGSGQELGGNLPGWRDFERSVALAFGGRAVESKAIFDVLVPAEPPEYGISCKMRSTLNETRRTGRVTIELSNSSAKFDDAFAAAGLTRQNMRARPDDSGAVILTTVAGWHALIAEEIDLERSSYFSLSYNAAGEYQLHQFSLHLPGAETMTWAYPDRADGQPGKRLEGRANGEKVIEYYYASGGQLKYYPHIRDAIWQSDVFRLEQLDAVEVLYNAETKAALYFPQKWRATEER